MKNENDADDGYVIFVVKKNRICKKYGSYEFSNIFVNALFDNCDFVLESDKELKCFKFIKHGLGYDTKFEISDLKVVMCNEKNCS